MKIVCSIGLVVALYLGLGVMFSKARAEHQPDVEKILDGKVVVYKGMCHVDDKGELSLEKTGNVTPCLVGADPAEPHLHFIGFVNELGYTKITTYNRTTKELKVVWRFGQVGA